MTNELIFIVHCLIVASSSLIALFLGPCALVAFICTQCILANLFVLKQISLCGFTATCADAFTVGATLGLNILQEYFGKEITKKAIAVNFFLLIFYLIASQIHLFYVPTYFDSTQLHYNALLHFMPRIVIASFSVYFLVQMLDYYVYGIFKHMFNDQYIVMRNYFSIALCQLVDTVLFSFFGLYGIVENIWQIIIVSYIVKLATIIIASPFVLFSRKINRMRK